MLGASSAFLEGDTSPVGGETAPVGREARERAVLGKMSLVPRRAEESCSALLDCGWSKNLGKGG